MTGFKLQISGVGSNRFINCATAFAYLPIVVSGRSPKTEELLELFLFVFAKQLTENH